MSLLLRDKLEKSGYSVVLTRESDRDARMISREQKSPGYAETDRTDPETASVLSVSIHQNSYHDAGVHGPQVFYYETSVEGKKLAAGRKV